ncbi:MAG: hypothetical protein E7268_03505 [Lachnospiraceae bacterium]|nr:hypothetical protein [Lachnospiraceae bacterium]
MRKILSYAKSHIYELHALFVATAVVVLMYLIKGPIKRVIVESVDRKLELNPELADERDILIRRRNMVLILLTLIFSFVLFVLVALISPLIKFSLSSAIMSGVFALCEYAFIDQITFGIHEEGEDE